MKGKYMMKKILLILLCLTLAAACMIMTACGDTPTECTEHTDANGDEKCDTCGADVPAEDECTEHIDADGDYLCDECGAAVIPKAPAQVDVTFTVKDDSGNILAGVTVILANRENDEYNVTTAASDAEGKVTAKVYVGEYDVYYDYDTDVLGYYFTDTSEVTVAESATEFELILIDNNPNGTVEKPYTVSAGENALTIPANTSYYYIIYRAVNLYFEATGATGIKVVYGESEYTADANGKIDFALLGADTNSAEILSIENTTDAEITFAVEVNSAPGTYGNPIEIETVGEAIVTDPITKGTTLYYTYTATESGFFTVELSTAVAYISMQNTRNSNSVNSVSDAEDGKIKLIVNAGDVIKIDVSVISSTETVSVTFTPTLVTLEAITPVKKD